MVGTSGYERALEAETIELGEVGQSYVFFSLLNKGCYLGLVTCCAGVLFKRLTYVSSLARMVPKVIKADIISLGARLQLLKPPSPTETHVRVFKRNIKGDIVVQWTKAIFLAL